MPGFVKKFIAEWKSLDVVENVPIVAAVSGGADSCALLSALVELRDSGKLSNRIIAAHFDHGLRGAESDKDERFTLDFANRLGVECRTQKATAVSFSENLEQSARRLRYRFLEETAQSFGSQMVLTGHTLNDQAETFLLNMIRGSGYDGLSAMRVSRSISAESTVRLVRPLIRWAKRSDTEEYCDEMDISYRIDEMNDDPVYSRVRVRKHLIPLLREFNPKIIDALVRNAETSLETKAAMEWFVSENIDFQRITKSNELRVRDIELLPPGLRRLAAREWLRHRIGNLKRISSAHIESVVSLACSKKSGKAVELPRGNMVEKEAGTLRLRAKQVEKTNIGDYN